MPTSQTETGYALPARSVITEDNYELTFPRSSYIYAKMRREDAQVTSVLKAVTLPIRRTGWWIDPNGADEEVVKLVAGDLGLKIKGDDSPYTQSSDSHFVWSDHLLKVLEALVFGHSFFEQVYTPGEDGREHLKKLGYRPSASISKIEVEPDGGLKGIHQKSREGYQDVFIPVSHLVGYVFEPQDATFQGTSLLRPAYKHWKLRDDAIRLQITALDRNSLGIPVYTGSDMSPNPREDLEDGLEIVEDLRSGDTAGASIPAGSNLQLLGINGQILDPQNFIDYNDRQIAKAMLAHFLNLDGKGGSYALADTQSDLFIQSLQSVAEWVADTTTQHVVRDLVEVAFPDYEGRIPTVSFDSISGQKELSPTDLVQLVQNKILFVDKNLDSYIRRMYGLPEAIGYEEALKQKKKADDLRVKILGETINSEDAEESDGDTEELKHREDAGGLE